MMQIRFCTCLSEKKCWEDFALMLNFNKVKAMFSSSFECTKLQYASLQLKHALPNTFNMTCLNQPRFT